MRKGPGPVRYVPGDLVLTWGVEDVGIVLRRDGDEYLVLADGEKYWIHSRDLTLLNRAERNQ
jgi:hypothetical protein